MGQGIRHHARRLLKFTSYFEDGLLVLFLSAMILMAGWQILARNFLESGFMWGDAFLRVLVLWVGLLGAMVATREYNHINIDVLSRFLPPRAKAGVRIVIDLFTCAVSTLVAWHAARFVLDEKEFGATAFASVPAWVCEIIIPIAFGVIALRYAAFFVIHTVETATGGKRT